MLARPDQVPRHHVPTLSAIVEENGFVDWLIDAEPGETLVYYRGHLSHDRMPSVSGLTDRERRKLSDVADRVLSTESMGLVIPVQRRVGNHDWLYLAVRTRGALHALRRPTSPSSRGRRLQHA
ncbi:hypothetical protein [Aestuariivirga sp.]|uniref:hypothetical protein n=1 Tax=Aestuariivirga sp. TaxID=2650926 RepID=UPI00391D7299